MKRVRSRLILGIFLFSAACTKATPDFEVLDEDRVPRPKFAGSYTKSLQTFSDSSTYQINGECDSKVRSITGSAVGSVSASAWDINGITVSGINLTCSQDGKFSFELKSLASLGYVPSEGTVYEIQLKSETSGGTSKPSYIKILFTSGAGGRRPVLVTSGGTGAVRPSNANGLSSSVRVTHKINGASRVDQ